MKIQEFKPIKFRYGTTKEVAKRLGITQSAATMRLRTGNMEAIEIAIQIDALIAKREKSISQALQRLPVQ